MKYLLALLFCFSLAAQQTVNNFVVKTNLTVAGAPPSLSVNTISNLAALNPVLDNALVNVAGYYTPGDGGGGIFRRVSSAGLTNLAAMTVISTANASYAWKRVWNETDLEVAWFGAFPDDVISDAAAINSAMTYAWASAKYNVRLLAGTYRLETTLLVPYRVNLLGADGWRYGGGVSISPSSIYYLGGTRTSLFLNSGANVPMLELASTDGPVAQSNEALEDGETVTSINQNSRIENLEFYGNGNNQAKYNCHAIVGSSKWFTTINNCSFTYIKGYALWLWDMNVLKISNLYVIGQAGSFPSKGIFVYSTSDAIINNIEAGNCTGPAVWYNGYSSWVTLFSDSLLYNNYRTNSSYTISNWTTNTVANFASDVFLESGDPVEFRTTGALPTGFSDTQLYFVAKLSSTNIAFHTNRSLAISGQYLTGSGTPSGTNTVIVGDPTSVYLSGEARWNTFVNIRADQNSGPGIVFRNAYGNHFYGVELFQNNGTNPAGAPETVPDLEKAGVIFDKNAYNNNVFGTITTQPIGYLVRSNAYNNTVNATYTSVSTNIVNLSSGTNYIPATVTTDNKLIANSAYVSGTTALGNANLGNALEISGNAGGQRILRLVRTSGLTQSVGLGVIGRGLVLTDETTSGQPTVGLFYLYGNVSVLQLGPQSSATPYDGYIQATTATGTNVAGGGIAIYSNQSTGNATTPNAFAVWTGDAGASGTNVQTVTSKFVIEGDGDVLIKTVGKGLQIKEGTNAKMGTATLSSGSATVSTTAVASTSRVFLTSNADGGTPGWVRVSARTAGTSFTITSSSASDTSTVAWLILDPAP